MTDREQHRKAVGERLRKARGMQKRKVVCEALGVSESTLLMWEAGKRVPRDEKKLEIAAYYHVPVAELFF